MCSECMQLSLCMLVEGRTKWLGFESQVDNPGCNSPLDGVSQERETE